MRRIAIGILLILALGSGVYFIVVGNRQQATNQSKTTTVRPKLYDVRTAAEFTAGHIDGAINLDVTDIRNGIFPDTNKDTPLALYCRSGNRANEAKGLLEKQGYTNVTNYGSVEDVVERGYTLVK